MKLSDDLTNVLNEFQVFENNLSNNGINFKLFTIHLDLLDLNEIFNAPSYNQTNDSSIYIFLTF